jgi:FAD binding domain
VQTLCNQSECQKSVFAIISSGVRNDHRAVPLKLQSALKGDPPRCVLAPMRLEFLLTQYQGRAMRSEDILVVGAGPTGLATSACLRRQGLAHVVLKHEGQIANARHRHYDRLHRRRARSNESGQSGCSSVCRRRIPASLNLIVMRLSSTPVSP